MSGIHSCRFETTKQKTLEHLMKKYHYIVLTFTIFTSLPAYAYIDPGTGLLFMQGFFAALGFLIAFVKSPVKKIKDLSKRLRDKK